MIEGAFSQQVGPHPLRLFYTVSQKPSEKKLISGANITLKSASNETEDYEEITAGFYELKGEILKGQIGEMYHIEIQLPNGKKYQSIPEVMPILVKGDSLSVHFEIEEGEGTIPGTTVQRPFLLIDAHTPLPNNENPYWLKWGISTLYSFPELLCGPIPPPPNTCFVPSTPTPSKIALLNGARIGVDYLANWRVGTQLLTPSDFEFRGRFYFLVNQQSITAATFEYWQNINAVADQRGNIFDPPPAAVQGNIFNVDDTEEIVLGYFEVTSTDSLRLFVTEGDIRSVYRFTDRTCPERSFRPLSEACCNCLSIENASLDRPSWW